jgi:nucleotide-binding universal stress UspA family protein
MFQKILLAYDGSEGANRALEAAIDLARLHAGKIWALAVAEKLPHLSAIVDDPKSENQDQADQRFRQFMEAARARAAKAGIEFEALLRSGHPAKTIVALAREGGFDVILVGHSGISGVWALLGTTAEKVSRHAPCSVIIVR